MLLILGAQPRISDSTTLCIPFDFSRGVGGEGLSATDEHRREYHCHGDRGRRQHRPPRQPDVDNDAGRCRTRRETYVECSVNPTRRLGTRDRCGFIGDQ
jgi:hypothetical protein